MKKEGERLFEGALVGAILGVVAGLLLAPESGKKAIKDVKSMAGDFYKYITPKIREFKKMTEKQYDTVVSESMKNYAKAKKLTLAEQKTIAHEAKRSWKEIKKQLK